MSHVPKANKVTFGAAWEPRGGGPGFPSELTLGPVDPAQGMDAAPQEQARPGVCHGPVGGLYL